MAEWGWGMRAMAMVPRRFESPLLASFWMELPVLFFCMSGVVEKRASAENIPGLDTRGYKWYCYPAEKGPRGPLSKEDLPMYFARAWLDGESVFSDVNKHCVDCRAYKNSTHIEPAFW